MQRLTHFDRKEIQNWHRLFLRDCPNGTMNRDDLLSIYRQFFPFGDPTAYCNLLFPLLDQDGDGVISFADYLQSLSMASRGRVEERIKWAFKLYDRQERGLVDRQEMLCVVDAIYRLMGSMVQEISEEAEAVATVNGESAAVRRVERLFGKLGKDELTVDDLKEAAQIDPFVVQGLLIYDGIV